MPTGVSIHIGVNHVDRLHYGDPCKLDGCVGDARAMHALAREEGFEPRLLLNEQATAGAVLDAIAEAAPRVGSDGFLLLTYSGHGGRLRDRKDDAKDPDHLDLTDETWCLHDRQMVDDELYDCWTRFSAGARVLVVSDSCFSGGVIRTGEKPGEARRAPRTPWGAVPAPEVEEALRAAGSAGERPRARVLRSGGARRRALNDRRTRLVYRRNQREYEALKETLRDRPRQPVEAQVMVLSAAQESETAADGKENGAFTGALLDAWGGGAFQGDYTALYQAVLTRLAPRQNPMLLMLNPPAFIHQRPFTI
jgi:hypothetical protein